MHRRDFLIAAAATAAAATIPARAAFSQEGPFIKRFADTDELAAYTRLSAVQQHPLILAHRAGYQPWGGMPECSIYGAEKVIHRGAAMIEIDIRTTTDGVAVCVHDETLDRETTGTGRIDEVDYAYIETLNLRDPQGTVTDLKVEKFEDFLDWGNNGALLWLDTKDVDQDWLIGLIREQRAESRVIVSAYGRDVLETYQRLAPDLVYFVPYIEGLGLGTLEDILATGIDPSRLIGMAGFDLPDMRGTLALAEIDAPALLDLQRTDQRYSPDNVNHSLYRTAVAEGLAMICTDQYDQAMTALDITNWA